MTQDEIEIEYRKRFPIYERALENVKQSLVIFLEEQGIPYLSVSGRVKTLESFLDKIERKSYSDPFEKNEDFCGLRVIVYYTDDIKIIQKIIEKEFDTKSQFDKEDSLEVNEFGYRSAHSIVKIKSDWLKAPNYRGLSEIKLEIQVRTILMHAWAEVQHKLVYKKESQVPKELQRQLYLLSAKFEEADKQFKDIKSNIEKYRNVVNNKIEEGLNIDKDVELNYDSLVTIMQHYLPSYPNNQSQTISILNELIERKYKISEVEELLKKVQSVAAEINKEIFPDEKLKLTRATLLGYPYDIFVGLDDKKMYTNARIRKIKNLTAKFNKLYN